MSESIQSILDKTGKEENAMKNDACQARFESIQNTQNED